MKSRIASLGWLPLSWYIAFLAVPLLMILATSFAARGLYGGIDWTFSFENYARAFDPLYAQILVRSLILAFLTAVVCLALGFPVALAMSSAPANVRTWLVMVLAVPFLTNLLIRVCALRALTAYEGPVAGLLSVLVPRFDPFVLSQNIWLVYYGMITTYLPFMVFPLFGAMERFDFSLIEAAEDLGASYTQAVLRVLMPAMKPAIASGFLLVFVPALGEFAIPDLLGGAKAMLVGNLIAEQFLKARDWPFGAALSVLAVLFLGAAVLAIHFLSRARSPERGSP